MTTDISKQQNLATRKRVVFSSGGNPDVVGGFKITWPVYLPSFWTDDIDEYIKNRGSGYTLVASKDGVQLYVNNYWFKEKEFDSTGYNYLIRYDLSETEIQLINYQIDNVDVFQRLEFKKVSENNGNR